MAQPDILQGLHDGIAEQKAAEAAEDAISSGDGPPPMPSIAQIMELLETLNISDAEKEEIKKNVLNPNFLGAGGAAKNALPQISPLYVLICVILLLAIFVFFGYKLYRSLTEKERKREEKKRQKQQKKKK